MKREQPLAVVSERGTVMSVLLLGIDNLHSVQKFVYIYIYL